MNKYVVRWLEKVILFCLPFIVSLIIYVYSDPFKVIKPYRSYYVSGAIPGVSLNRGHVSTSMFDNNYSQYKYDSFIFGNSRSIFYEIEDWKPYIAQNSSCFHFDASGESLYGIYKKIKYLERKNIPIINSIMIIDHETLIQAEPMEGNLFAISPQLEDNTVKKLISFHLCFVRAFLTPKFMVAYFDYKMFGKIREYMKKNSLLDDRPKYYDTVTNELSFPLFEKLIEQGEYYTFGRMNVFYQRDSIQWVNPVVLIKEKQKKMLSEIKAVFVKNNTNFNIIINPLYDQKKINEKDFQYLVSLFGKDRVFDFSGINNLTNDYTNFYEASHYRPHVAKEILEKIYSHEQIK